MTKLLHIPTGQFIHFLSKNYIDTTVIFEEACGYTCGYDDGIETWIKANLGRTKGYILEENWFLTEFEGVLREEVEIIYD